MRGFELVSTIEGGTIPTRSTSASAGYDVTVIETATIKPGQTHIFATGVKAFMQTDEVLSLHVRSSIGIKRGLILSNITGIIDSDYYNNQSNEGHIMVALRNTSDQSVTVEAGERVCQAIFSKYLVATNDDATKLRTGGIGSTN